MTKQNSTLTTNEIAGMSYNQKLEYAFKAAKTKASFVEIARDLDILDDLQDACRADNLSFDDWLDAFGIVE